jgi:Curli production assembly/transport component CsgG
MRSRIVAPIALACALTACSMSSTELGGGGSMVQGSAGEAGNAQNEATALRHCDQPLGTVALVEDQTTIGLAQYGLESPVPLLRLLASQSNCFAVVDRGQALDRMIQERNLASQGLLQSGSNVGGAQIIAADYLLTPFVNFSEDNAGGISGAAGALASFLPYGLGSTVTAISGGVTFREAQTMLAATDQRTGLQIASAEGSAKTSDVLGGLSALGGMPGFGSLGAYSNTNQGKVVAAAFLDAFNNLVDQLAARKPS